MVLLARKAVFSLARLNMLAINVVSFPMQVNVAHLCVGVCVISCCFVFRQECFCGLIEEGGIVQNVVNGVFLLLVLFFP